MNLERYGQTYDHVVGKVGISLTHPELRQAFDLALARQTQNLGNGARHRITSTKDGLWQQVKGVVGEIALNRFLDRPLLALDSLGDYRAPDALPNVEVRTTTRAGSPLPLWKQDHDPHPFVLAWWDVDVDLTVVWLIGWAFKVDVAREAYWDEKDGHWSIWPAELRAMHELAALQGEQRGLDLMDRVAKWKAKHPRPQPQAAATSAPAASTPADAPTPTEAAETASSSGTAAGSPATGEGTADPKPDAPTAGPDNPMLGSATPASAASPAPTGSGPPPPAEPSSAGETDLLERDF